MTVDQQIPEAQFFHAAGGIVLPSMLALRSYLRMIPTEEFLHHVSSGKNDFADWVEHAFQEKRTATKMRSCKTREEMVWVLDDVFAELRMQRVLRDDPKPGLTAPHVANEPQNADPIALEDDDTFRSTSGPITTTNDRVTAGYEEIARRMQDALKDPMPKEFEKEIERLKTRRDELSAKISAARKTGHDALIAALVLQHFQPKLAYALASREPKDFSLAAKVLDEAELELKEAIESGAVNVREEVLALAKKELPETSPAEKRIGADAARGGRSTTATNTYKPTTRQEQPEVR